MTTVPKNYPRDLLQRLKNELQEAEFTEYEGVSFCIVDNNQDGVYLHGTIDGPNHTPYKRGTFILEIRLSGTSSQSPIEIYPYAPPKIKFITKIFHPNISSNGEICLDTLYDQWLPVYTLSIILLSIQALLSKPNCDDFVNPEAAFLYQKDQGEFNRKATAWTEKYAITEKVSKILFEVHYLIFCYF